jgi:hypothetical protein
LFERFHTVEDIVGKKNNLAKIFRQDQKVKATHKNKTAESDIHLQMESFMEDLAEDAAVVWIEGV